MTDGILDTRNRSGTVRDTHRIDEGICLVRVSDFLKWALSPDELVAGIPIPPLVTDNISLCILHRLKQHYLWMSVLLSRG